MTVDSPVRQAGRLGAVGAGARLRAELNRLGLSAAVQQAMDTAEAGDLHVTLDAGTAALLADVLALVDAAPVDGLAPTAPACTR
jgi:hypothetical protein